MTDRLTKTEVKLELLNDIGMLLIILPRFLNEHWGSLCSCTATAPFLQYQRKLGGKCFWSFYAFR